MKHTLSLFTLAALTAASGSAFAWTFDGANCSPESEHDLDLQTPNIYIMVDHSGSMNEDVGDRTCHVCNDGSNDFMVDGPGDCQDVDPWSRTGVSAPDFRATSNGYSYTTQVRLSDDQRGGGTITLQTYGDFDSTCAGATVYLEGSRRGTAMTRPRATPSCGSDVPLRASVTFSAADAADGVIEITIDTQDTYYDRRTGTTCPGVDRCATRGYDRTNISISSNGIDVDYVGYEENSVCGYETKWEQAVVGLTALANDSDNATPQVAAFGYGTFEDDAYDEMACAQSHGDDIIGYLDDRTGECCDRSGCDAGSLCVTDSGSTAIPDAIDTMYGSSCFDDSSTPSAGILITDGQPTVRYGSVDCDRGDDDCHTLAAFESVERACANRAAAPLFMVGLGSGTDEDLNNLIAAASQTGSCVDENGAPADPCDYITSWDSAGTSWRSDVTDWECEGSFQVNDSDELIDALRNIAGQLACTFSIDFLRSNQTSVPEDMTNDYDYLAVNLIKEGVPQPIYNADSSKASPAGEGWRFASADRKFVKFTEHYCDEIQAETYSSGTTQLACLCQEVLGSACSISNYQELGVCPDGVWACAEGVDYCEPETDCCTPDEPCDTGLPGVCGPGHIVCDGGLGTCVSDTDPSDEVCDELDNDCDGEVDEGLDGNECTIPGAVGRCAIGLTQCADSTLTCIPLGAQPELCNGLDDDCDGFVDNMMDSWDKASFSSIKATLSTDGRAAACGFNDVCRCPDGPDAVSTEAEFSAFLDDWSPHCLCGEGLGSADESPTPTSDANDRPVPRAGCATTDASGSLAGLLVFGFLAARRRRR